MNNKTNKGLYNCLIFDVETISVFMGSLYRHKAQFKLSCKGIKFIKEDSLIKLMPDVFKNLYGNVIVTFMGDGDQK
jgi:hypothetical protein